MSTQTKLLTTLLVVFIINIIIPTSTYANQEIFINEVQIEPSQKIEIWNNSESAVDISNWFIDDSGGSTFFTIPSETLLQGNSCLVFESNFYFNKTSPDVARLFNNNAPPTSTEAILIDSFNYEKSPGENLSFQRETDGSLNWIVGLTTLGFNNFENSSCLFTTPSPTIVLISPTLADIIPTPTEPLAEDIPTNFNNIFLSEVHANPNEGKEWVEIYNGNTFTVELKDWYIDDTENAGGKPQNFTANLGPLSYVAIELPIALLNNSGDKVRLLNSQSLEVDSFSYQVTTKGLSYSRQDVSAKSIWWCQTEHTKNNPNLACPSDSENISATTSTDGGSSSNNIMGISTEHLSNTDIPFPSGSNNILITLNYYPIKNRAMKNNTGPIQSSKNKNNLLKIVQVTQNLFLTSLVSSILFTAYLLVLLYNETKNKTYLFN